MTKSSRAGLDSAPSWNDAWMFASLRQVGRSTLLELIARADHCNRAIPTAAEIRTGLRQLYGRGLISVRAQGFVLTDAGRALHERGLSARGGLFTLVDRMHRVLESPHCPESVPRRVRLAAIRFRFIDNKRVARAYREYLQWINQPHASPTRPQPDPLDPIR